MPQERFIDQIRRQAQATLDPNRSTVEEELQALDWQLRNVALILRDIERSKGVDPIALNRAVEHLDTAVQRSHRAQQIAKGLRVTKAT